MMLYGYGYLVGMLLWIVRFDIANDLYNLFCTHAFLLKLVD